MKDNKIVVIPAITKWGMIYLDDLTASCADDKLRIYDSDFEYMNYIEAITVEDYAEENNVSIETAIQKLVSDICSKNTIEELLEFVAEDYEFFTQDIEEVAVYFNCEVDEIRSKEYRNEFVNHIGNYWVVISE